MTVTQCIPEDLLPAFLEGELPNEDSSVYEEHLLTCSKCLERTRTLRKDETVAVRREEAVPNNNSPAAEALMKKLVDRDQLQTAAAQSHALTAAETPTVRPGNDVAVDTSSPVKVSVSSDLNAGDVLGPYRILSKLGQGGMGAVYKATHVKLDKVVALKVLSSQVTRLTDAVTRFEREMRAVGKLEHPHIVRAMDAGEIGGIHYLAMEYVDGTDLQLLVKNRGNMSVVNACKAIRQSAMALAAAHAAGLVHRDIKPSNLLVGKNGQIKLLDLGLALLADDAQTSADLTTAGQSFGTPDYMAPEQWEDAHAADARTDLYALGCTLFFLLVGRAPYATEQHRTAVGKMKGHVTEAIPSLKAARADVPVEVVAIYEKLVAKAPKDRFQTAAQLVEALAPFVTSKATAVPVVEPLPETAVHATNLFQSLATATDSQPKPAPRTAGRGKGWTPRQLAIAAGGAAGILLLAVIVITITNKDGSKTKVEVQGDAKQIDIAQDGKSLVKITPGETTTPTPSGNPLSKLKGTGDDQPVFTADGKFALEFEIGDFQVKSDPIENPGTVVNTMEVWCRIDDWREDGFLLVNSVYGGLNGAGPGGLVPKFNEPKFQYYTHHGEANAVEVKVPQHQRIHLAGVNDGQRRALYLNGRLIATSPDAGVSDPEKKPAPLCLGYNYRGQIEALRISSTVRYTADFKPPQRFEADEHTEVLYNFSEGSGDVLHDRSGHNRHGKIVGAKWVRTDGKPTGWYGWPTDAPKPAIAPFDAAQAKKHQEEWAAYLQVPVEYTNSLGMKFRLIPPGEFLMGSTDDEVESHLQDIEHFLPRHVAEVPDYVVDEWKSQTRSERPQHQVILTQPIYLAMYETTQAQYQKVTGTNPSYFSKTGPEQQFVAKVAGLDTSGLPVEGVTWVEAAEFCAKLSQLEKWKPFYSRSAETVTPLPGTGYRLPTEAEWEFACRAGTTTRFWIGNTEDELARAAWFGKNSGRRPHNVGELMANPLGLYDVHGNAWEWVEDAWEPAYFQRLTEKPAVNPSGAPSTISMRILRGGDDYFAGDRCRSSHRSAIDQTARYGNQGFRVALMVEAVRQAIKIEPSQVASKSGWHDWPADAPKPAIAPFNAAQAKKHQEEWAAYLKVPVEYTNSLGMKFRLIPPGEFMMGSTPAEIEAALAVAGLEERWQAPIQSEGPQHRVILTQPIYVGVHEVTQSQYEHVMGTNPSHFSATGDGKEVVVGMNSGQHPVERVAWNDAAEFCAKLSQQEKLKPLYFRAGETITSLDGTGYRLPSEAEWEFACRAGTTTKYWGGDRDEDLMRAAWIDKNSGGRTHAVGELKANPFGLFDIHGNVWEWVQDGWDATWYGQFQAKPAVDPSSPYDVLSKRVLRDSGWSFPAFHCRSAHRADDSPNYSNSDLGFRVTLPVNAVRHVLKVDGPALTTDAVDYTAERKAAEWLAKVMRQNSSFELKMAQGNVVAITPDNRRIPDGDFVIDGVFLWDSDPDDEGMSHLAGCTGLQRFTVRGASRVTAKGACHLLSNRHLKSLHFSFYPVFDGEVVRLLSEWKELESFELHAGVLSSADQLAWPLMPQLKDLNLADTTLDEPGLRRIISRCPNLTSISIAKPNNDPQRWALSTLGELPKLSFVVCSVAQLTDEGIETLKSLPALTRLHISSPLTDASNSFQKLAPLAEAITDLSVHDYSDSDPGLSDDDIATILKFRRLKSLVMTGNWDNGSPTDEHVQQIALMTNLKTLTLQFDAAHRRYTPAGIAAFRQKRPDVELTVDGVRQP